MPIYTNRYTLGGTAIEICPPDRMSQHVVIHEADHSESTEALIGGPAVGTANGLHLHAADTIQLEIGPGDGLFAISAQGAPIVHVLRITQD